MKKLYFLSLSLISSFIFAQVGTTCADPIVISSLPYTTTDNTSNYANNYNVSNPSSTGNGSTICSNTLYAGYYHSGNDVIYSYTPTVSGTIKIEIPSAVAWTGMFVYTSCSNIGVAAIACAASSGAGARTINNLSVTEGQTYYILISSWSPPVSVPYTLNITQLTMGVENEIASKKQVAVYPNPAENNLNFKSESKIVSANVYSMDGKKIKSPRVNNDKISIENLQSGSYIVEFRDQQGNSYTKSFIKK